MEVYDFGEIKLHAYQTNDLMNDESYILENKDNVLLVEFPAFYDNLEEFETYVRGIYKNRKWISTRGITKERNYKNRKCKNCCRYISKFYFRIQR